MHGIPLVKESWVGIGSLILVMLRMVALKKQMCETLLLHGANTYIERDQSAKAQISQVCVCT